MAKEKDDAKEMTSDDRMLLLLEALVQQKQQAQPFDMEALREVLSQNSQATASAMQKALKPENTDHPGVSAFSYPEGDRERPRDSILPPGVEVWYFRYPMHMFPETEHWRELELAAQVQPGTYTILRKDESTMQIEVVATTNGDGKIRRLEIGLPNGAGISREDKWLVPPKTVVLYQLVHSKAGSPKRVYIKAMQEYLLTTVDEPEAVSA
jgi:hypothetical protein